MPGGGCERAALAVATGLCAVAGWSAAAQAQSPAATRDNASRQQASDAPVAFDIPAQPLAAALNAWAVQANTQVFVDPRPVAHLRSPAIKGTLRPRQALRALLAHSNLQVARGADGVFVIKSRPAPVAAAPQLPEPTPPTSETAAVPAVVTPPPPLTARASEGPWLVGILTTYTLDDGGARSGGGAAVAGEYFITDHVAAALSLTVPRSHSFEVQPGGTAAAYRASARLQSSALSLKYYFMPEQRLRPYLGAGIDVTTLYGARGVRMSRVTVGPGLAAGLDFRLSPHWMLNADLRWTQIRPEATGSPGRDIRLDPLQFGLGFVYRFATPGWQQ